MFRNLKLSKPLAVVDLETTGVDPARDRVVEISVLRVEPTGDRDHRTRRVNPEMPIPAGATAVHGITDGDVADCHTFKQIAPALAKFLDGCDLCGYNLAGFDSRMLDAEFKRVNVPFTLEGRAYLDPMKVFQRFEKRDLSSAVRFYLGREHTGAHGAEADVLATADLLDAMLDRYADLPRTPAEIDGLFRDPNLADQTGRFRRNENGDLQFNFGKHRGVRLLEIVSNQTDYCYWLLDTDFAADAKEIVRLALAANGFPPAPVRGR